MKSYTFIIWILACGCIAGGLIYEIKKECKKVGEDECKTKKKKIIGLSLILLGLLIIIPGVSWAPLIYVWAKYGKREGIKVLIGMIVLTIVIMGVGAWLYFEDK